MASGGHAGGRKLLAGAQVSLSLLLLIGAGLFVQSLLAGVGVAVGLPTALAVSRLVSSQLFGIAPNDPATIALATAGVAVIALLSGFLPARRATRVDPITAIRCE